MTHQKVLDNSGTTVNQIRYVCSVGVKLEIYTVPGEVDVSAVAPSCSYHDRIE